MMFYQEVERSIIKKFRKEIWSKFVKAVQTYQLINENDKIMVCISGGKDSFLLAKCMQELQRHGKFYFDVCFVVMNPGYSEEHKKNIIDVAERLNIPIQMFESDIFAVTDKVSFDNPCYLCARMRRGYLYNKAKELGCNKIALGHHFNDVIETSLMSMLYSSEIKTMMPKLKSDHFSGLYLVHEDDIIAWRDYHNLKFINCACRFTEECSKQDIGYSKRKEIKELIKNLKKINANVDQNIFKSMDNVNLNCVLGYSKNGMRVSFNDDYPSRNVRD